MPLYYFHCSSCYHPHRKLLTPEQALETRRCEACGKDLIRSPRPPSCRVVETLDNGVMNRRIERLADAERLFRERNEAVNKKRGGE